MSTNYQKTSLWQKAFSPRENDPHKEARNRLSSAHSSLWQRCLTLAQRISSDLPNLTLHDEAHLTALWEIASKLCPSNYDINPLETFVLGAAIAIHDVGHAVATYEGRRKELVETLEYKDTKARLLNAISPLNDQSKETKSDLEDAAIFATLRLIHSDRAETLLKTKLNGIFLIEETDLRESLGQLIGRVAASHNWSLEKIFERFCNIQGPPGCMPTEWGIQPIKLACILRCADALQIDERRAPKFALAIHKPNKASRLHWIAQNIAQPVFDLSPDGPGTATFTSQNDFEFEDADAWWLAYDLIQNANRELQNCYQLMKDVSLPPLAVNSVAGADSAARLELLIRPNGWRPINAEVKISNIENVVQLFGGEALYGPNIIVPLRELIQNAADAIRARRVLSPDGHYRGRIIVSLKPSPENGFGYLQVADDGSGMSERTLTGTLLDFGKSFWNSEEAQDEFPGLLSKRLRQTGRYGIGFFSALMIAESITVTSKRYNDSKEPCSLVIREGLKLRPLLSKAIIHDLGQMSTIVRLQVKTDHIENLTLCAIGDFSPVYVNVSLEKLIAHLCPCVDCDIYITDESGKLVLSHQMLWDKQEPLKWLRDVILADLNGDPDKSSYLEKVAANLRIIVNENGESIGRAAIGYRPFKTGIGCIGGLIEGFYSRNPFQFTAAHVGVLGKNVNGPRRDSGTLSGLEPIISSWASEQAMLLSEQLEDHLQLYSAARNVAAYGGDPISVATIVVNREPQRLAYVFDLLEKGKEIFAAIEYDPPKKNASISLVRHQVNPGFRQSLDPEDVDFNDKIIVEGFDPFLSDGTRYHSVKPEDESSFISCLKRFCETKQRTLQYEIVPDYPIVIYKGEAIKREGLTPGMEIKMTALRLSLF